jgi:hypothetical protein
MLLNHRCYRRLMLCLFQENKSYGIKTPSKMAKGKKTMTLASAAASESAATLAHMAEELGREEAATNSEQVAPAANTSGMGMVAAAVCDLLVPVAKNRDSILAAKADQQRRQSDGEGTAAASTWLAAKDIQTPKGSAPSHAGWSALPRWARPLRWSSCQQSSRHHRNRVTTSSNGSLWQKRTSFHSVYTFFSP